MNNIPDIAFESKDESMEIEFLDLKDLFDQIPDMPNHDPLKPHRIKFNAILIVTGGKGSHQVDLENYSIEKGDILKIAAGQVHAFQGDLNYSGVLVIFTEDFILHHFSQSTIDNISHLYNYHFSTPLVKNVPFIDAFLADIATEFKNKSSMIRENIIAQLLALFLLRIEQMNQTDSHLKRQLKHYSLFIQFQKLVEDNYQKTRNVVDYADMLLISPKHLNTVVRTVALTSAKAFIDQFVILEIKRSIQCTDRSLKEIAYQHGFDEMTNFSKYFRKHTTISPRLYKNNL